MTHHTSGAADLPEALRIAAALEYCDANVAREAITELRRPHAENGHLHPANPGDTESGPEGEWYCETHPDQLMGHAGCGGAGIPACARIGILMNQLRLTKQEVREANRMRDEMAAAARRAQAICVESGYEAITAGRARLEGKP